MRRSNRTLSNYSNLEQRNLLAGLTLNSPNLIIDGSMEADSILVTPVSATEFQVSLEAGNQTHAPVVLEYANFQQITVNGLAGDDILDVNVAIRSVIFGGDGNDTLRGGSRADSLIGGAGNDILNGRDGNDTAYGNSGNDVYSFQTATAPQLDRIIEAANNGSDKLSFYNLESSDPVTVNLNASPSTIALHNLRTITANDNSRFENAVGGAGDDFFLGSDFNNVFNGNRGDDFINGGGGNDYISGGDGNDFINGSSGNDTLIGGSGNDDIIGSEGNDNFVFLPTPSLEFDSIREFNDQGNDTLDFSGLDNAATVRLSSNSIAIHTNRNVVAQNTQQNFENITGSSFADDLIGNYADNLINSLGGPDFVNGGGGNDILEGGEGNDFLNGASGNDTIFGGPGSDELLGSTGNDSFVFQVASQFENDSVTEYAAHGTDQIDLINLPAGTNPTINLSNNLLISHTGRNVTTQNLSQFIENVRGTIGDDTIVGNSADNEINGQSGHDFIDGAGGDDIVLAGAGDDVVYGSHGNDQLIGQDGNDQLFGGPGQDLLSGESGDDEIHGGEASDEIFGGDGFDLLNGDEGPDLLFGGEGRDSIFGGEGDDVVRGQAGIDTLNGQAGRDQIFGGTGSDIIEDLIGDNEIFGDNGADSIVAGAGADQIDGGAGDDTIHGGQGNDLIIGGLGNDALFGGNGDDILRGEDGDDRLRGQQGSDSLNGGEGADNLFGGGGEDVSNTLFGGNGIDLLAIQGDEDAGDTISDANVEFENLLAGITWTDAKIERYIDVFDLIKERTGSYSLLRSTVANLEGEVRRSITLKLNGGTDYHFNEFLVKDFDPSVTPVSVVASDFINNALVDAWNTNEEIYIGLNRFEYEEGDMDYYDSFLAQSQWTFSFGSPGTNFVHAGFSWWYRNSSEFFTAIGNDSPLDDYQDTWNHYFLVSQNGTGNLGQKLDFMQNVFGI